MRRQLDRAAARHDEAAGGGAGGRGGGGDWGGGGAGGVRDVGTPGEQDHAAAGPGTRHLPHQRRVLGLHLRRTLQGTQQIFFKYQIFSHPKLSLQQK